MDENDENYEGRHVGSVSTIFSNRVYDFLKFVALVLLPALGTLYFGIASIWGLPKSEEVVGTLVCIDTFLGVILGISNSNYKSQTEGTVIGFLDVHERAEGTMMQLNFPGEDPMEIKNRDKVTFKVRKVDS